MAQVDTGVRSVLSMAPVYNLLQSLLGAPNLRNLIATRYFPDEPSARVLDIGCGTAGILEHLPDQVEYVGFDISQKYVDDARRKHATRNATFFKSGVQKGAVTEQEPFDVVLAIALLHHLEDNEAVELFQLASDNLKKGGICITLDNCWLDEQRAVSRYLIGRDRGRNVRTPEGYASIAQQVFQEVEVDVYGDLLRVPYDHVVISARKS